MSRYNVVAVLGKRLKSGITKEYASRIDYLLSELEMGHVAADLIGFSGGKTGHEQISEAEVGRNYFAALAKTPAIISKTFLDPHAQNTIENVANILAHVQETVNCSQRDVTLTLVSSDYHLERLEIIDQRMPAQSLLKPLREKVGELRFLRAPYPYHDAWQGKLYLLADKLTIMRVNIEGIRQRNLEKVLIENVRDFLDTLLALSAALHQNYDSASAEQAVHIQVDRALAGLMPYYFQVANFTAKNALSEQDRWLIELTYKVIDEGIKSLNRATDPDQPIAPQLPS